MQYQTNIYVKRNQLIEYESEKRVRENGHFRLEGKDYIVRDCGYSQHSLQRLIEKYAITIPKIENGYLEFLSMTTYNLLYNSLINEAPHKISVV
jgi:hypothetical protein